MAVNTDLLCLNLNNTFLDERCGDALVKAMEANFTIIQLDIETNKQMNYLQILEIQKALLRNKEIYDAERLQEWKERKLMGKEEEDMEIRIMKEEEHKEIEKFEARFLVKLEKEELELDEDVSYFLLIS